MSENPFYHVDESHNVRVLGVTSAGWAGLYVVLCIPMLFGFFALLLWNLSVKVALQHVGYIPYSITKDHSIQAFWFFLACCFLIPIPVLLWIGRQDAKRKLRQTLAYLDYLKRQVQVHEASQNGQNEREGNAGA